MRAEDLGIGELFGRIRDAVIVADAETQRIGVWDPTATKMVGYSASEALNKLRIEELVSEHLEAGTEQAWPLRKDRSRALHQLRRALRVTRPEEG